MEKNKNVPKLRFPEFTGEWEEKKLGEITNWASGGTPSKENLNYWNGDIPWITASSMRGIEYSTSELKITEEGLKNGSKLAPKNSLLILVRGSMLFKTIPIGIAVNDVAFNQDVKLIDVFKDNKRFILYWFLASENLILNQVTGTGIGAGKLDLDDLKSMSLSLPLIPEQTKIASFLTAVDEKLTQLKKKKKTLLEQYKKGIMQKLFSQELRFKDNNNQDFPDWQEKTLGEISANVMYGMNSSAITYDGINKYLRITDIDEDSRRFIPNPLTSPEGVIEDKYKLKEGDIVFARTGASVGKSYLYNKSDGNLLFAGFLIRFSIKKENPYFIYVQTMKDSFNKWVQLMSMRSGQPGINAEEYKILPLDIPSLPEQQKIANFLSAIDVKINYCRNQIEKMEAWKKGLLQQMFC